MQIQSSNATSELNAPLPAAATNSAVTAGSLSSTDALGNESTFLQLLVAQIQNQDPTAPMDSSTFLTQLAEFSQLEQLIAIQQDVKQLDPSTTGSSDTTPSTGSTS